MNKIIRGILLVGIVSAVAPAISQAQSSDRWFEDAPTNDFEHAIATQKHGPQKPAAPKWFRSDAIGSFSRFAGRYELTGPARGCAPSLIFKPAAEINALVFYNGARASMNEIVRQININDVVKDRVECVRAGPALTHRICTERHLQLYNTNEDPESDSSGGWFNGFAYWERQTDEDLERGSMTWDEWKIADHTTFTEQGMTSSLGNLLCEFQKTSDATL